MNKADMDRLISLEADRIRCCAERLIELYPPAPDDDHSLEAYIAAKDGGDRALESLSLSLGAIIQLLDFAEDHADLLK